MILFLNRHVRSVQTLTMIKIHLGCVLFLILFVSCRKEKDDIPSPSTTVSNTHPKIITNINLQWKINYVSAIAYAVVNTLPPSPAPHCVDSISKVFILFATNSAQQIGNTYNADNFYYNVQNNSVIIYRDNLRFVADFAINLMFISGARIDFQ